MTITGDPTGKGLWAFDAHGRLVASQVCVECDQPGKIVTSLTNSSNVPSAVVLRITTPAGMGVFFEAWCRPGESVPLPPGPGRVTVDVCRDSGDAGFGFYAAPDAWAYECNADGEFGVVFCPGLTTSSRWRVDMWVPYPPDEALRTNIAPPPHAKRFRLHAMPGDTGTRWIEHGSWSIARETFGLGISRRDVAAALGGMWIECSEPITLIPNPVGAPVPQDRSSVLRIEWECEL